MRTTTSILTAVGLAAASLVGIAPTAHAAPTLCDPNSTWLAWSGISSPWTVTHASRYENYTTKTVTWTRSASFQRKLSASLSVTAGASVSADVGVASLDAHTSYTLAAAGEATSTSSTSETGTLPSKHVAVFFAGDRQTSGSWSRKKCSSNGQSISQIGYGTAKSFSNPDDGVVDCAVTPPSNTLAYVAKKQYC